MAEHFNKLTPAEAERIAFLMEECAEIVAVCGKILRHGFDSHNPTKPDSLSNRRLLEVELGDTRWAMEIMISAHDVSGDLIEQRESWRRRGASRQYFHHQGESDDPSGD